MLEILLEVIRAVQLDHHHEVRSAGGAGAAAVDRRAVQPLQLLVELVIRLEDLLLDGLDVRAGRQF